MKNPKMVALVLEKMGKGGGDGESMKDDGELAAAEDILGAVEGGDARALAKALKAYTEICIANYEEGNSHDEDMDEDSSY